VEERGRQGMRRWQLRRMGDRGREGLTWEETVAVEEKGRQGRRGVDMGREGGS